MRGKFEIAIIDAAGKVIRTVPGSPRRGINKVDLPLRRKAPATAASDAGFAGGSFIGPLIAEGRYTVEIRKGADTLRTFLDVVTDTIYKHSAKDRELQQATVDELYALNEDLAVSVARIRTLRDTVRLRLADTTFDAEMRRAMQTLHDTAVAINNDLVNSKVGFVTGEEQLRERLAALYGEVNSYLGRPSEAQLVLTTVLTSRVVGGRDRVERVLRDDVAVVNAALRAAGKRPIGVEAREMTYQRLTK